MDFSERMHDNSQQKVLARALALGLFPRLQWKVIPFRASDGNPVIIPMVLQIRATIVLQRVVAI